MNPTPVSGSPGAPTQPFRYRVPPDRWFPTPAPPCGYRKTEWQGRAMDERY